TAGRGRDGRTWHSPAGGVWLGVLLRPGRVELGVMSVRVGLAVADAVDALLGRPEARLKWPNDVLLAERKLAGILCEGRWQGEALQWLAVGVGVNVCNSIPGAVARRARRPRRARVAATFSPAYLSDAMLLAININNTETKVGLFRGDSLESHWRLTTTPQRTPDEWASTLTSYLAQAGRSTQEVRAAIVASVVPPVTQGLCEA